MPKRGRDSTLSRRGILKAATAAGVTAVGSSFDVQAQTPAQVRPVGPVTSAPIPIVESGRPREMPIVQGSSGSDYMADVIKSLGIEHVACNPGTSFRGLHESLINYLKIDWHTCTHEEASVAKPNRAFRPARTGIQALDSGVEYHIFLKPWIDDFHGGVGI